MPVTAIVIIIFVVLLVLVMLWMRNTTTRDFKPDADETIGEEITGIKVESRGIGPESTVFPGCKLIVTDKRIIVAQKMLFGNNHQIRYVFHRKRSIGGIESIKTGYVQLNLSESEITVSTDVRRHRLEIACKAGPISSIHLYSNDLERLKRAITTPNG